ncbi:MAG: hypothetical protein J3K34DRAFT_424186 [Monoraphidium minutum]|nr:MAG: hypothetical protein J3K34DRAFT_424186 [Monoraphidium minutum]
MIEKGCRGATAPASRRQLGVPPAPSATAPTPSLTAHWRVSLQTREGGSAAPHFRACCVGAGPLSDLDCARFTQCAVCPDPWLRRRPVARPPHIRCGGLSGPGEQQCDWLLRGRRDSPPTLRLRGVAAELGGCLRHAEACRLQPCGGPSAGRWHAASARCAPPQGARARAPCSVHKTCRAHHSSRAPVSQEQTFSILSFPI